MNTYRDQVARVSDVLLRLLMARSVDVLRWAMGAVFLGFGVLKFFPGTSPAENLAVTTTHVLTLGLVPDPLALVGVATLECTIGFLLLAGGRLLKLALLLLVPELAGILSPVVLLPVRLFAGPGGAPTLEAQYVLKDVILVGATMVIAANLLRTSRRTRVVSTRQKLEIVLAGLRQECPLEELCEIHGIAESEYQAWKHEVLVTAEAITAAQEHSLTATA